LAGVAVLAELMHLLAELDIGWDGCRLLLLVISSGVFAGGSFWAAPESSWDLLSTASHLASWNEEHPKPLTRCGKFFLLIRGGVYHRETFEP